MQLSPTQVTTDPNPETTLHWIPLASLLPFSSINSGAGPIWSTVSVDTASRLAPRHSIALRLLMRALVGSMQFPALILSPTSGLPPSLSSQSEKSRGSLEMEAGTFNPALHPASPSPSLRHPTSSALKLWGLSLGMTLDLLAYMSPTPGAPLTPWDADIYMGITRENGEELELNEGWNGSNAGMRNGKDMRRRNGRRHGKGKGRINAPPSLTSVFPRFSYPDVNFWIWVFGKRYREVIRGWEVSIRAGGTNDRRYVTQMQFTVLWAELISRHRINWTGAALTTFYAAVRKALIVVLVLRAIGVLVSLAFGLWWVFR